ncbi:MAG: Pr6Pr family membrane protein [Firmicutes bacterium]|nr:Pr6Pr family membrane protein [Eubacterium sp.]MBQ3411460.1 Pr6Pr family membrane protein [Oscillospiraceae bacterium]MBR0126708.1 Pr6Pr family membrane protein [Bacillota bacterium]
MKISGRIRAVSIFLKAVTVLSVALGVFLTASASMNTFMGGGRVFMFFTIQSNIAIAIVSLIGMALLLKDRQITHTWYVIKFVATVSITLTGLVFTFILAPTMGRLAWNFQNTLTHAVVPLVSVIDYFVTGIFGDTGKKEVFYVTLPPLAYAIYAGIGYAAGWEFAQGINYPYFFLNWGSPAGAFGFTKGFPFMGCVWWILALLVLLLTVGYLYLLMVDGLRIASKKRGTAEN